VEELLLVRQGTIALKEDVLRLNGELQVSGEDLVAKVIFMKIRSK
jgi:hypothetical protein